jgi:hypothetical protein
MCAVATLEWLRTKWARSGFALLFAEKSAGTDEVDSLPAAEPPPAIVPSEVAMAIAAFGHGKCNRVTDHRKSKTDRLVSPTPTRGRCSGGADAKAQGTRVV